VSTSVDTESAKPTQRLWRTRLAALGLGLGIVGLVELGLRIGGVAEGEHWTPPRLVTIVQDGAIQGEFEITQSPHFVSSPLSDGQPGFRTEESYRLGKGGGFPAQGCMRDQHFAASPAPGVHRYIVLGGSAAMGQNPSGGERQSWVQVRKTWNVEKMPNGVSALPDELAISGQLAQILAESGHSAEVINAGMIAQDSGAVRDIAMEALEFSPTALILYLGNNEGIGLSQGLNGLEVPTSWPRVQGVLHQIRIYRVLAEWIMPAQQRAAARETIALQGTQPEVLGRLTLAQWASAGEPLVDDGTPTDEVYQALMARFETNLRTVVEAAHAQGVDVYIIPTPPHLAYAPFYKAGPGRPWANDPGVSDGDREQQAELREQARSAIESKDWGSALKAAQQAVEIDPYNADAHYFTGWALSGLNRTAESLDALLQAHALDVSRKRTHPAFAVIAQQVCADLGCKTTSAHASILAKAQTEGVTVYDRLLGDHEHLNPSGNAWIASLFAELILESE
jgi:hypothetical protein